MIFEELTDEGEYNRLHNAIFAQSVPMPSYVTVCKTDAGKTVGFISGFWINDNSFYIQYAGVFPEYRRKNYIRYFSSLLDDNVNYSLSVLNTHITAIKIALAINFIPVGCYLKDNLLFLQFERGKLNG